VTEKILKSLKKLHLKGWQAFQAGEYKIKEFENFSIMFLFNIIFHPYFSIIYNVKKLLEEIVSVVVLFIIEQNSPFLSYLS
jgi:hypothetical protein